MKRWQATYYLVILLCSGNSAVLSLLSGKVLKMIPDLLGPRTTEVVTERTTGWITVTRRTFNSTGGQGWTTAANTVQTSSEGWMPEKVETLELFSDEEPHPPDKEYPVQHAGAAQDLQVRPLPLHGSDHELMFNVSWSPPKDFPARDYSLEVSSVTDTVDCNKPLMCYEYNIPGDTLWRVVPAFANPVAESCSVRPGCAYSVVLIAHPWDGRTVAQKIVELDECVEGVCSCAHSPRLPAPHVSALAVVVNGEICINVTWTLPTPEFQQRLPRGLKKQDYLVSIGKQMVTDAAHPSPWFANTISQHVSAAGLVADGDSNRWLLIPVSDKVERSRKDGRERGGNTRVVIGVKLLARVSLIDERGCVGPAGNATAYDPSEAHKIQFSTYIIWAIIGGVCMLVMVAVFAMSARIVKRVLSALRPTMPAPLAPLRQRPAWLPLQARR